jgi:hypothetical protein
VWRKDLKTALRFDPAKNWIVKLELHQINGTAGIPTGNPENWWLVARKTTFSF